MTESLTIAATPSPWCTTEAARSAAFGWTGSFEASLCSPFWRGAETAATETAAAAAKAIVPAHANFRNDTLNVFSAVFDAAAPALPSGTFPGAGAWRRISISPPSSKRRGRIEILGENPGPLHRNFRCLQREPENDRG